MADYRVLIKPSAAREYERLPASVAARVASKIESLGPKPRPHGVKKLEGAPVRWRLRAGDWRIIYAIDDARLVIEVLYIRHRSKAYD
ncbi:MAG TPA: type II toxin-antitoxin system RelE/ParE family toxin [Thermoanaerobaculia bacterium]|nr:type II toxin-antitoxin system RelE/ParE family toxin [Thermoanaerobaculia bacterium]